MTNENMHMDEMEIRHSVPNVKEKCLDKVYYFRSVEQNLNIIQKKTLKKYP